jgi:hypothetical protein
MRTVSVRALLLSGLVAALLLAGVASYYASGSPDGLNRVAGDLGFASAEQASGASNGPLAGYEVVGLDHARWSGGLAGVLGCVVVLGCSSLFFLLRTRSPEPVPVRHNDRGE